MSKNKVFFKYLSIYNIVDCKNCLKEVFKLEVLSKTEVLYNEFYQLFFVQGICSNIIFLMCGYDEPQVFNQQF